MAVTGTGTQADPFIVHNYSEFMSLSGTISDEKYIQFFEDNMPNQIINCNDYGSEFKWHQFNLANGSQGVFRTHINLNGCTIKNFLIADGEAMFQGQFWSNTAHQGVISVSNGSIRNVFMGSSTSKIMGDYAELHDISLSANISGLTITPFDGADIGRSSIDNCALYITSARLSAVVINRIDITDTDMEFHINDQNGQAIFSSYSGNPMTIKDCRVQGKISGVGYTNHYFGSTTVLGAINAFNQYAEGVAKFVNSVIDVDTSESQAAIILAANYDSDYGTNVICKSHFSSSMSAPQIWNFMTHEQIRDGDHLNDQGFIVVEVNTGG